MLKFKPGESIEGVKLNSSHDEVMTKLGRPQEVYRVPEELIEEPEDNTYYWCYLKPNLEVEFYKGNVICIHAHVNLPKTYKTLNGKLGKKIKHGDYEIQGKKRRWEYYESRTQFVFNSKGRIINISVDNRKNRE